MSEDDARDADTAATALDAHDGFLAAWSRRLADATLRDDVIAWAELPDIVLPREALDARVRDSEGTDARTLTHWINTLREGWQASGEGEKYLSLARHLIESGQAGASVEARLHADLARAEMQSDPASAWSHVHDALRGGVMDEALLDVFEVVRTHGAPEDAAAALEEGLSVSRSVETQARVHALLGEAYRNELSQPEEAIRHYEAAVFVCGDPAAPLRVLAELYGETGDAESRVAVLERLADLEPDRRGALLLEASAATDPSTGRAIELAESARAAGEPGAVDALRRLYRDAERWDGLAELLLELSEDAPDDEASALLSERAEVLEEHLLRPRAAAETWEALRIRAPKDTGVLRRLERLYTNLADTGARIAVLEAQLESEGEDTGDVRRRLAQARVEAEEFSAAGEIAEELLAEKRDDPVALDVLEQVVERTDDPAAAEALFASYADVERWQDASRLARGVASRATELESALSWLERARDVEARSLGDPHAAFALTLEIFRRSSGERPELRAVRDAAERVDGWRSLAATVEDLAEQREDIGLATFLASIYAEKLANLDRAGKWVDHALSIDPDHVPALWLRTGLDAEAPLQIAHVKPLRRLARRVEAERRVEVLTRLAAVHRALRQTSDELAVIAELEEMSPTAEVVKRHDALLKANGAFEAVVRRWERRASQADGLDAESLWLQAAVLRRKSLSDAEGALGNLRHLAAIAPASLELEAELDAFVQDASASRDARDQAIRLRLDALRRAEDPARLRDGLERSIAHASEDDRTLLRVELAELLEGNDEHDAAFAVWLSALRERPSSNAILEALWRHAERSWRWGALVEALRDVAASSEEPSLLRKVAEIEEGPLQDPQSALSTWRQVAQREQRAEDEDQVRRLLLVLQDWDGVIRWHRARAERSDDPELVRASLVRIAALEVAERADVGAAMNALELLVEREPAEARWTLALVELAERAGQWDRATAALEAAVAATADEAARVRWLHRLAILERDARGDATRAAAVFEQLLETRSDDVALWEQLESTYRASESWPALAAALERRAEALGDEDALSRAALLTGQTLSSPREALALAARVATPSAELRDAMRAWLPHAEAPDELARQLVASSSPDERGAALTAALGAITDADLRADYALELATVAHAEDRLDDALGLLLDELDAGATRDDVWEQIVDLCDDADRVERAAERILSSTFDYGDPEREARVALAIGGLASDERELADLAEPLFLRALEIDPASEDALDGLEGLYVAQGRGAALLRVLTRAAEASDAPRRAKLYARVAAIAETRLNDPERALAAWASVLEAAPDDTAALRDVARIATTVERWSEAIDAMQRLADAAAEPGERASWLAEAAAVVVENQEYPHGAVALLDEASELAPDDAGLVDRLIDVLLQLERPTAAVEALEERAARVEGAPERAARYWARAAELRVDALEDPDGAIEAAKNALEADPSEEREDTLIALLRRAQRIRELLDQLERLLERAGVDVIAVHLEIASLAATALGDRERAGRHLEAARVLEPSRIDVRVAFAEALRLEGDLDAALAEFDSAMESAPPADRALLLSEKGPRRALGRAARGGGGLDGRRLRPRPLAG